MTTVRALARLLREAQTSSPEDVVATLVRGARSLGGRDLVLYLIDYEQQMLQPTPALLEHGEPVPPASVLGTMAACLEFQGGRLRDDATLLLLEWAGSPVSPTPQRLALPQPR